MSLRDIEKLKSTLVLVPVEGEFNFRLDLNEMGRYLRDPIASTSPAGMPQITSVRDQMVVVIAGKIQFEDQSDAIPPATSKLAEVAHGFMQLFGQQALEKYRAYGWNFDVAFDAPGPQTAAAMIADTFLDASTLKKRAQITPTGAGIRVFFEQGAARCQLQLEPKQQDLNTPRFYAHINYHYEIDPPAMPPK